MIRRRAAGDRGAGLRRGAAGCRRVPWRAPGGDRARGGWGCVEVEPGDVVGVWWGRRRGRRGAFGGRGCEGGGGGPTGRALRETGEQVVPGGRDRRRRGGGCRCATGGTGCRAARRGAGGGRGRGGQDEPDPERGGQQPAERGDGDGAGQPAQDARPGEPREEREPRGGDQVGGEQQPHPAGERDDGEDRIEVSGPGTQATGVRDRAEAAPAAAAPTTARTRILRRVRTGLRPTGARGRAEDLGRGAWVVTPQWVWATGSRGEHHRGEAGPLHQQLVGTPRAVPDRERHRAAAPRSAGGR